MKKDGESPEERIESPARAESSLKVEKTRTRGRSYVMDLRIHSPASLGYLNIQGIDTAPALVRLAKVKGLDVIAVTDYHSGRYVDRILEAAKDTEVTVIPGVVLRCSLPECRDVPLLCLFGEGFSSQSIEDLLLEVGVPRDRFGDRAYTLTKDFATILAVVERLGGIAIPTRMDKTPYRKAALSVLIERFGFRAFDLAYADSAGYFKQTWPKIKFQLFSFSNANALAQIGSRIAKFKMDTPGLAGLKGIVGRQA